MLQPVNPSQSPASLSAASLQPQGGPPLAACAGCASQITREQRQGPGEEQDPPLTKHAPLTKEEEVLKVELLTAHGRIAALEAAAQAQKEAEQDAAALCAALAGARSRARDAAAQLAVREAELRACRQDAAGARQRAGQLKAEAAHSTAKLAKTKRELAAARARIRQLQRRPAARAAAAGTCAPDQALAPATPAQHAHASVPAPGATARGRTPAPAPPGKHAGLPAAASAHAQPHAEPADAPAGRKRRAPVRLASSRVGAVVAAMEEDDEDDATQGPPNCAQQVVNGAGAHDTPMPRRKRRGAAGGSEDLLPLPEGVPETLAVACNDSAGNDSAGTFVLRTRTVVGAQFAEDDVARFARRNGRNPRIWQKVITVAADGADAGQTLGQWLQARMLDLEALKLLSRNAAACAWQRPRLPGELSEPGRTMLTGSTGKDAAGLTASMDKPASQPKQKLPPAHVPHHAPTHSPAQSQPPPATVPLHATATTASQDGLEGMHACLATEVWRMGTAI